MSEAVIPAGEEYPRLLNQRGLPPVQGGTPRDRGEGPFKRLVLRAATVLDGTGAPPWGPVDIAIEHGRIVQMAGVGSPLSRREDLSPIGRLPAGDREIDCFGKFVTPGFVDCHAHIGWPAHAEVGESAPADYIYKLWLAHGVTTVREMGSINGLGWSLEQKRRSASNAIAAPRMQVHAYFPAVNDMLKTIFTPAQAKDWVYRLKDRGADGVKFFGASPAIMRAALEACAEVGLRSGCHHAQQAVTSLTAMTSARMGLTSAEHYYGLPEALFEDRTIQDYPSDYNYANEYHRFATAGRTFMQSARPGSAKWNAVMDEFLELGFSFVPTFGIYDANRDLMRARQADWHADYTWKNQWKFFQPSATGHGAYWYRWSTANEVEWKQNYQLWMAFINEFKNRGGRVCVGSDSGFIFQIYGFGFVRELELLQEAGFHPLEVLRAATSVGASLMGLEDEIGRVETGYRADLLIHEQNPLSDFKLLYGTGALRLDERTGQTGWQRALQYTIKDGIVFDTAQLLADVRQMVAQNAAPA